MINYSSIAPATDSLPHLGRLLLRQTGATVFRSLRSVIAGVLCLTLGFLLLLITVHDAVAIWFPVPPLVLGALFLVAIPLGRLKLIACYENGVIVKQPFKSRTVLHKDVAAVQFLAVKKYKYGIYVGTIAHFTVMPMLDKTVNIRIYGSRKDSDRVWTIAQTILMRNPDARLEKLL